MNFWKSLSGMLTVELTGADPENILSDIIRIRIPLYSVEKISDLTYRLRILRRDYRPLIALVRKQGHSVKILEKRGIYWTVRSLMARPVLVCVAVLLASSAWYLPSRILFVSVEGNAAIPARKIMAAAEDCGICFGASRKLVRSEKVKNELLSAVPELQWAGVNTAGCRAVISVRERVPEEQPRETNVISNVIADRDGYILSATVTGGTALVAPGETVTKGQMLISGYTDGGICIRATRAEGEILAQTNREFTAVMPEKYLSSIDKGKTKYAISLLIGKKRINLWKDSRISRVGCGRMYTEYYISLPGDFQLPAAICVDRYQEYHLQEENIQEEDAREMLGSFSESYLLRQMVAGEILNRKQQLSCEGGRYLLECSCTCREMIGKEQREQIGDINEQRN